MTETLDRLNATIETFGAQNQTMMLILVLVLFAVLGIGIVAAVILLLRNSGARTKAEGEIAKVRTQAEIDAEQREDTKFTRVLDAMVGLAGELTTTAKSTNAALEKITLTLEQVGARNYQASQGAAAGVAGVQDTVTKINNEMVEMKMLVNEIHKMLLEGLPKLAVRSDMDIAIAKFIDEAKVSLALAFEKLTIEQKRETGEISVIATTEPVQ